MRVETGFTFEDAHGNEYDAAVSADVSFDAEGLEYRVDGLTVTGGVDLRGRKLDLSDLEFHQVVEQAEDALISAYSIKERAGRDTVQAMRDIAKAVSHG